MVLEEDGTVLDPQQPVIDPHSPPPLASKIKSLGTLQATAHTPVYTMHKFWARRPWKLFKTLIREFTSPGDLILDPFAGGGVVLVEGLAARRRVITVDINTLATSIMFLDFKP
ncbi:MAG: DNA methyltransferase [Nitrososphaerota archaeon]